MRIVLYVIAVLWVAGAIFSLLHTLRKTKRHEKLVAGWPKVQATVTGNVGGWSGGSGGSSRSRRFYPAYQFVGPNGILYAGESEVAYNPANPNQSFQVSSDSKAMLGCLVPFFALFSLLLFWVADNFPLG